MADPVLTRSSAKAPPRSGGPGTDPVTDFLLGYPGRSDAYWKTAPLAQQLWHGTGQIIPHLIQGAQQLPATYHGIRQLESGEVQAPPGWQRAVQDTLQRNRFGTYNGQTQKLNPATASDYQDLARKTGQHFAGEIAHPGYNYATRPVGTLSDASLALEAPDAVAARVARAAKLASDAAEGTGAAGVMSAAYRAAGPTGRVVRNITRPLAKAAPIVNPAGGAVVGLGNAAGAGQRALRTAGLFGKGGDWTDAGLARLQSVGDAAFPNGEITAAEYADPRFRAHMAQQARQNGLTPASFKQGVMTYSGVQTPPRGPVTGIQPRAAAAPRTAQLIQQGHQDIDAQVGSNFQPPAGTPNPTAADMRAGANDTNSRLSDPDRVDLRLAAAGKDALDSTMAPKPPATGWVPAVKKTAQNIGAGVGGALAAVGGHPDLAHLGQEALGFGFGMGLPHTGVTRVFDPLVDQAKDVAANLGAGAGAPAQASWLDVPKWTGAAAGIGRPVPYLNAAGEVRGAAPPPAAAAPPPTHDPTQPDEEGIPTMEAPAPQVAPLEGPGGPDTPPPKPAAPSQADIDQIMKGSTAGTEKEAEPEKPVDLDAQDAAGHAAGGRVGFDAGGQVDDDEVGQHLKGLGYWRDNPGGDWLARKRQYAEEDAAQRGGKYGEGLTAKALSGASTAGMHEYPMLPVSELAKLPGVNNEQRYRRPGQPKYDRLMQQVREAGGFDPVSHPVFVNVNHRGEAYLNEGNHRTAVAHALGVPHLKTEVRWFNGGERAPGPWSPENVARMSMAREGRAAGGVVVDMTEKLLKRAKQAQEAERSSTKPLLALSDDHVAQALRVAQRGL